MNEELNNVVVETGVEAAQEVVKETGKNSNKLAIKLVCLGAGALLAVGAFFAGKALKRRKEAKLLASKAAESNVKACEPATAEEHVEEVSE